MLKSFYCLLGVCGPEQSTATPLSEMSRALADLTAVLGLPETVRTEDWARHCISGLCLRYQNWYSRINPGFFRPFVDIGEAAMSMPVPLEELLRDVKSPHLKTARLQPEPGKELQDSPGYVILGDHEGTPGQKDWKILWELRIRCQSSFTTPTYGLFIHDGPETEEHNHVYIVSEFEMLTDWDESCLKGLLDAHPSVQLTAIRWQEGAGRDKHYRLDLRTGQEIPHYPANNLRFPTIHQSKLSLRK